MSDRGWGNSCGGQDPDRFSPQCTKGYNHLMDDRYEVRDAQYLLSVLADEGVTQPQKIAATGPSYGGGISMALAALKDRVMLPDGSLAPWTSPGGHADANRRGGAGDSVDRPRLLADAEWADTRLRGRRSLR